VFDWLENEVCQTLYDLRRDHRPHGVAQGLVGLQPAWWEARATWTAPGHSKSLSHGYPWRGMC